MTKDFEFYETPETFTRYLFSELDISGRCAEVCAGSGAIVRASLERRCRGADLRTWATNDLDPRWPAEFHMDATQPELYETIGRVDWHIGNTPFTSALAIIEHALKYADVGVAMHLRASIHEVLKTGIRRTWMQRHPPTGILWLPRFGYQRSKKTGEWSQDSVCACWVIWLTDQRASRFIKYAPEWVLSDLAKETPIYRARMDRLTVERKSETAQVCV